MLAYIVRRLLWMVVLLFAVSAITFVIFYVLPSGDPAQAAPAPGRRPSGSRRSRRQLGLDKPKIALPWKDSQVRRYYDELVLHQDLGTSYRNDAQVWDLIKERLPATIQLALGAVVVWLLVAIPVGIVSALRRRSLLDRATMGATLIAISAPVYWLGLVALYLFDETLGRFPLLPGYDTYGRSTEDPAAGSSRCSCRGSCWRRRSPRSTRGCCASNLIDVMSEDYIRTARAKGLRERRVVMKPRRALGGHADRDDPGHRPRRAARRRGAHRDGLQHPRHRPRWPTTRSGRQDLPTIQGTVLFAAFFIIVLNLIVDIAYAFLDPRVRY